MPETGLGRPKLDEAAAKVDKSPSTTSVRPERGPPESESLTVARLAEVIAATASTVDDVLDAELPRPLGAGARLAEAMRYSMLGGGKRLRAFLVRTCAQLAGAGDRRALILAAAVEMIHGYSLIHDDLPAMDDDDMRRGRPSCHIAFDDATAILAGDALLTLAFELAADPRVHP